MLPVPLPNNGMRLVPCPVEIGLFVAVKPVITGSGMTVTGTPDGVKQGNKEATLENGLTILVPHIVSAGEQVVINTEDFSYIERVTLKKGL